MVAGFLSPRRRPKTTPSNHAKHQSSIVRLSMIESSYSAKVGTRTKDELARIKRFYAGSPLILLRSLLYTAQSWGLLDVIGLRLATSLSRIPFRRSDVIQGTLPDLTRLVLIGAWLFTMDKNLAFQSAHKTFGSSLVQDQSCREISLRKFSRLKLLKFL